MTAPNLEGCREKLKRAKHHVADLEVINRAFLDDEPYYVLAEDEPHTGRKVYRFYIRENPPESWGPIIGDVMHNLRAALDHLWWEVVKSFGETPGDTTTFPIGKNRESFKSIFGKVKTPARQKAFGILDAHKPYAGGNNLLWWLHRLNIVDKHRHPLLLGSAYRNFIVSLGWDEQDRIDFGLPDDAELPRVDIPLKPADRLFPLKNGDEIFSIPKEVRGGRFDQDPKFTFEVAFGDPEVVKGEALIDTLNQMTSTVEGVIDSFVGFPF